MAKPFVLLMNIKTGERFFTSHIEGVDPTKLYNGEVVYKIIDFAETSLEAQKKLFPVLFPFLKVVT